MKKIFVVVGIVIVFVIFLYYKNYTQIKSFVRVITGPESEAYVGVNGYSGYDYNEVKIVPPKIDTKGFNLAKYNLDKDVVAEFDFTDKNLFVLIKRSYIGNTTEEQNTIFILNKNNHSIEEYPAPLTSAWSATHISKVGDNLFVRIFHRVDWSNPYQPEDNNYYIFNIKKRQYEKLELDYSDIGHTVHSNFYVLTNPNNSAYFAVGYCNKKGFDDCGGFGVALSDSHYLKKVMDVKMPFTIGWKDNNLFIKKDGKVYLTNPSEVK